MFEGATLVFEMDTLHLAEVDPEGQVVAMVAFDPSDRPAASAEMFERYVRGEGAPYVSAQAIEALRAIRARDLDRLRTLLPDDFVLIDHRRTGVGRVEGADALVASFRPVFDLSPNLTIETLYDVAVDERGALAMTRMYGTLAEGGGEFESFYARLFVYRGDRPVRMELFEPGDLDAARARFEALGKEPSD
jgi:ketosteroid isomerase-like protein